MRINKLGLFKSEWRSPGALFLYAWSIPMVGNVRGANYQDTVIRLSPTYYYQLNETAPGGGAVDAMGAAPANGVFNGDYVNGPPMVGVPGPLEVFGGIAVPGVGGEENLAHASNNAGHITLGDGNLFASSAITVAFFFKAGPAEGGDRLFTNNLEDATKSFQVNVANDGLVLAVDPANVGLPAERTLYLEDNSAPDRRLINSESGWFHVVASTSGTTGSERASNLRLWINGIDRTTNLQPDATGWGTDLGLAKIGGRRANAADSTTHSGAQDEFAIWLNRVLTDAEVAEIWESAVTEKVVPLVFTDISTSVDGDGTTSATITWQSRPARSYSVFSSPDLVQWEELDDSFPSQGERTSYTKSGIPEGVTPLYFRVADASP